MMNRVTRILLVLIASLLVSSVYAQDNPFGGEEKKQTQIEDFERKKVERKTIAEEEGSGPRAKRDTNIEGWEAEKLENLTKALKLMETRVQRGDPDEERYPEYLERLSEMYMKMARYYDLRAFERLEQSDTAKADGNDAKAQELLRLRDDDMKESVAYREKALEILARIADEYPRYENADKALFYLGFTLGEMGRSEDSKHFFHELVREHPDSRYISEALLGLAEYAYMEEELSLAEELYSQVVELDPEGDAAGYAMYKKGWVYFNQGEAKSALQQFQNVVKHSEKSAARGSLKREAVKDLVKAYSLWDKASPKKAKKYFKKFAEDDEELTGMLERLARLYSEDGQIDKAITMYNRLMKDHKGHWRVVGYQIEIMLNKEVYNDPNTTAQAVKRTVLIFSKARKERWEGITDEKEKETYDMLEQYARETAKWYHLTAQTTKNALYYALAYELYDVYVENFPEAQDNFEMMYYYAELLYWKKMWPKAANRYDFVVEMALEMEDPSKEEQQIMTDAAYGAVLSYHKTMGEEPTKECPAIPQSPPPKEGEKPEFPEFEIPECRSKLIAAVDRYIKLVPESEELVDIKYTASLIFYNYNHFEEAIKRFDDIAMNHSDNRLAILSANLVVDSVKIKGDQSDDYTELWETVQRYKGNEALYADPNLAPLLDEIEVKLAFKFCQDKEEEKDWVEAAECYEEFAQNYQMSELVDKALWNASVDWENASEIQRAVDARKMLLKIFGDGTPLAPDALFAVAQNYHGLATYSKAAHFYEMFANAYPGKDNACSISECSAEAALSNAAAFRAGLGQYKKAVANYDLYIERYPDSDKEIAKLKYNTGKIYFDQKDYRAAVERYKEYLDDYARKGTPGQRVGAYTAIGRSYWRMNSRRAGVRYFEEAEEEYNSRKVQSWLEAEDAEPDQVRETMAAAAEARFMQGEYIFAQAMNIALYDEENDSERHLQRQLKKKAAKMQEAIPIYTEVIQRFNSPHWGLAALCRLGMMFHDVAKQVESSPVPKRLTEDQMLIYEDILIDFASQFEKKAVGYYVTAVTKAAELGWFNEYTTLARQRLFDLRPREYRSASEIKAQPDQALVQWQRSNFYTDIEEAAGNKKRKKRRVIDLSAEDEQKLQSAPTDGEGGENPEGAPEGGETPDATQ